MKLKLKEDPKEWRKQALLTALGLAVLSCVLRWRHALTHETWLAVLAGLGCVAACAVWRPRWFRGYYRLAMRLGFGISQLAGRVVLTLFFFLVLTPLGLLLRLAGKDLLQLKRPDKAASYWQPAKETSPLDRMF